MIRGLVQGVGFRPFVCRLAVRNGITGEVVNRTDGVSVIAEGDAVSVRRFIEEMREMAPPASDIKSIIAEPRPVRGFDSFNVADSKSLNMMITEISPDIAVCDDCVNDMQADLCRIDYPFVNCTNCGPRFTVIMELPYDRINTTMSEFQMCQGCVAEYHDMLDRRYHAQPIACNSCGPGYSYYENGKTISDIREIVNELSVRLTAGKSVAVKGLGGYHLICDALNNEAVAELRKRKKRDAKPFAVMFSDISSAREYCYLSDAEEKELVSWRRPILILRQRKPLAEAVNGGLTTIGAMLPYMPLHYMLFRKAEIHVIVMTSGNISDDPVITDDLKADEYLTPVTGALLSYNREIYNRTDDSVAIMIADKLRLIRRSRGFVPRPVDLQCRVEGIMATGAEQKNTFCIGKDHQAIISQHIGDLKNLSTYDFFSETIARFSDMFRFRPEYVACDLHPDYLSTRHALMIHERLQIPLIPIQHHHAHIASCMAENGFDEMVIGVCLDGTGFGTDGNIWGSEFMIADLSNFTRYTHFDYFRMPGGDAVVAEPWRMALSCLYEYFGDDIDYLSLPSFNSIEKERFEIVKEMIRGNINSPLTSGAGRIFDAVSALTGLCMVAKYDSEAPMRLEAAIIRETDLCYPFAIGGAISLADTFTGILKDMDNHDFTLIPARFHNTVATIIMEVCLRIRKEKGINRVVLSGGVFQNRYLLEKATSLLDNEMFEVYSNRIVPSNDGGISLGQLIIASKRIGLCV